MNKDDYTDSFDDGVNTFTLIDDEGREYEFELLDFVDYRDRLYAVLLPVMDENTSSDDDGGVVIMETVFEGNEPVFDFVEDEKLAEAVLHEYSLREEDTDDDDTE